MQRRQLIKESALAMAAFGFSRDLFTAPFQIAEQSKVVTDKIIRLSSNENPHGPSVLTKQAMMEGITISNRYQWDMNAQLREQIGSLTGHSKDHISVGAGSSELLGLTCMWASQKNGNLVASEPTFKLWMNAARKMGLPTKLVPTTAKKENDLERMLASIDTQTKLVYLCNPNNPTGTVSTLTDLEAFIKKIPPHIILLVDEAYTDYYDSPSMAKWVNTYPNLIIAKTFSKIYGMAGARLGYVLAQPNTIKQLNELQAWPNSAPSAVTMQGAMAAMKDIEFTTFCKKENNKAKEVLYQAFERVAIPYIPSFTSFVYFDSSKYPFHLPDLFAKNNILGARSFEENSSWLRLSIGTVEEMQTVSTIL